MKIAHIVCTYPPYYGGMGNVAFEMVNSLIERGHDVTTYTPLYGGIPSEEDIAHVERIAPRVQYGNAAMLPSLYERLHDVQLVHLHYPFFGVAYGMKRWKHAHPDIPLVVTYHMDARSDGLKGIFMKWYAKLYMPRIVQCADAVTVSSFDYAAISDAHGEYQHHPELWHEVPFGVDMERFAPEKAFPHIHLDLEIPSHHKRILFVGGMDQAHYFKGISVLLQALQKIEDTTLILIGDGDMRSAYELEAAERGVGPRTRFLGSVSDDALPRYYASVDATILPSIHGAEAFGMVLLESMACGTPVVASDLPGVRTVAMHGGVVTPPGDATQLALSIRQVLEKELPREEIRGAIMKKYTWDVVTDRVEEIYRSLV
jgi:glycosyltransferase involved in cell wall biosynthesis